MKVIKNDSSPENSSTHQAVCPRHTVTSGKYVFPTRSLYTYLWSLTHSSTVKDIQEYISWNMNQHKPGKSTMGMMLFSLLMMQDNYAENMVWRDYRALFQLSRGWWPGHTISTHLQPFLFMGGGTRIDIIAHMLKDCQACFTWGRHLKFCN